MITFTDVENNEYQAQCEIEKTDAVNGEKSLSGTIYFGQDVKDNISKGWTLSFLDEDYVVVTYTKNDKDNTVAFSAVQAFFYKMSKTSFYETWNGSHTFNDYLDALFNGTGYTYDNTASVAAFEKQNWGMSDRLSLFNDIIDQANVEFYVEGTIVHVVPAMGSDLSTIVRKKFNLDTAEIQTDNTSFATYGRGYGAYSNPDDTTSKRLTVEYKSPLYDYYYPKFGAIEAIPVADERYTIAGNLLTAVKEKVDKSWAISLTLNLVDLQSVGYKYAMATPGDYITVIDENINFSDKVRIIKVTSDYDIRGKRTKTEVECGSLSFAEQQKTSQSTLSNVAAGKIPVPNEWLTSQVQIATNSLLAARTELSFTDQGIIAVDKSDANKVVILNSAGVGVSTDGGQVFKTAITAGTINADNINIINLNASNITTGTITGANLRIDLNTGEIMFTKGAIKSTNGNLNIDISSGNMAVTNSAGNGFRFEDGKLFLTSNTWIDSFQSKPDYGYIAFKPKLLSNVKGMQIAGTDGIAVTAGDYDASSFLFQNQPKSGSALSLHDNTAFLNAREHVRIEGGGMYTETWPWTNYTTQSRAAIVVGGTNGGTNHDAPTDGTGFYYLQEPVDVGSDIFMKGSKITLQGGKDNSTDTDTQIYQLADLNLGNDGKGYISSAAIYNRTYSAGAHVVMTRYGTLGRLTSARKYKIDISNISDITDQAHSFLSVEPKQWFDKAETEGVANGLTTGIKQSNDDQGINPYYGFIAEDLYSAGLDRVVSYGTDGELEGIQYDRLTVYHHELIRELYQRVNDLEAKIYLMEANK